MIVETLVTAGVAIGAGSLAAAVSPLLRTLLAAIFRRPRSSSIVVHGRDVDLSLDLPDGAAPPDFERIREVAIQKARSAGLAPETAERLSAAIVDSLLRRVESPAPVQADERDVK